MKKQSVLIFAVMLLSAGACQAEEITKVSSTDIQVKVAQTYSIADLKAAKVQIKAQIDAITERRDAEIARFQARLDEINARIAAAKALGVE